MLNKHYKPHRYIPSTIWNSDSNQTVGELVIKYQDGAPSHTHTHLGTHTHTQQHDSHTSIAGWIHVSELLVSQHSSEMCFESFYCEGVGGSEVGTGLWSALSCHAAKSHLWLIINQRVTTLFYDLLYNLGEELKNACCIPSLILRFEWMSIKLRLFFFLKL